MTSAQIRQHFLEFFRSKGHQIVTSAPIVLKNDPTLLFTNAGMNQFKDFFLGNQKPAHRRVADTQKCLRVSGKHNDLEEVGVDTYHHTMFEMLGNWSFGDYFKKEATQFGWELLTDVFKIDPERLYVTVFEGDKKENLPKDEEEIAEWKKWIDPARILLGKKKDNFWEMGEAGPCGPCTEIHIDCRPEDERKKQPGKKLVNADHPQVIEIWNIVFIQFNRLKNGKLELLPEKHVDTGMGFERLVRVLQGKQSNYDTDVFSGLIERTEIITGEKYKAENTKKDIAFRVIADHIRAIAFAIADGQLPSNTGAGYVIRRILRRAVRYYYSHLNYKQTLLHQLVHGLAAQFEKVFPELNEQVDFISKVIKEEENNFLRTIDSGLRKFNVYTSPYERGFIMDNIEDESEDQKVTQELVADQIKYNKERNKKIVAGAFAFELNDTYGFPVDLTDLMAKEIGWSVDFEGFNSALAEQKQRSRTASFIEKEDWIIVQDNGTPKFVGYDALEVVTNVLKYRKVRAKKTDAYQLVLETTPFYAESGGQVGDTGILLYNNSYVSILDTKKENDLIIHIADRLPEGFQKIVARVDSSRRNAIMVHHSATHLVHAALRKILGTHVQQKGSLVNDEHLRFDFSHFSKLNDEEIADVEKLVNDKIRENIPVIINEMPKDEALKLGAIALFGEKYGDIVRVVIIDPEYSIELCGGTHVGSTGELGFFKITHETAVAAGVRRIEAVSGSAAELYINEQLEHIGRLKETLKSGDLIKGIESLMAENVSLKKKLESFENKQVEHLKKQLLSKVEVIHEINFLGSVVDIGNPDALKKLGFALKSDLPASVIVLASASDGKANVVLLMDEKICQTKNLDAGKIIKDQLAPLIKGGGGGQKTVATGGGMDTNRLPEVIRTVRSLL